MSGLFIFAGAKIFAAYPFSTSAIPGEPAISPGSTASGHDTKNVTQVGIGYPDLCDVSIL